MEIRHPGLLAAAGLLALAAGLGPARAHEPVEDQIAEISARIAKAPKDASLFLRRGEMRRVRREWAKALEDYRRARDLDPDLDIADLCTGLLMLESGRTERALAFLDTYLEANPDRADALTARARARMKLGRLLPAVEDDTRAIALHRGDDLPSPDLYLERARALDAAGPGHLDEAISGLDEGLERLGRPVTLQLLATQLETKAGRFDRGSARRTAKPPASSPPAGARALDAPVVEDGAAPSSPGPAAGSLSAFPPAVLVDVDSTTRYLANTSNPGIGLAWIAEGFDDSGWGTGPFGVGYEAAAGAENLIRTGVPVGTSSVLTRTEFDIADISKVGSVFLGADYDDGYVAWINGVEVHRSPEIPPGAPLWDTRAGLHESSNGLIPDYGVPVDITAPALTALHNGRNLLAVGVWNASPSSSDLVLVPQLSINHAMKVTRGPYLQEGTPESVVVRWRTDVPTDSRVRFGDGPGRLVASADIAAPTTEHVVAVTGLRPATRYFYSVGSSQGTLAGDDADHHFVTSPVPGTPQPARIWVLGDSGTADARPRMVRDAYESFTGSTPTSLWLMLGDNAYQSGTDSEYQAAVFDVYPRELATSVLWPTLGNHDGLTARSFSQSGPYYDIFTLPAKGEAGGVPSGTEAYYAFDYANVHFICLDSYDLDRSPGGAMMTWLAQDIRATTQDWVIAFWHHPPYSKGSHDTDFPSESTDMRQVALPILEGAGVDLVLSGHSHDYERSFLLDGHYGTSGTLTPSMKLDPGSGSAGSGAPYRKFTLGEAPHEGAVYAVAGSSGQIGGGALNHPAMYLSLDTLGSMVLDVNGKELRARFLDATGAVRDDFTIRKGHNLPPVAVAGADAREECTGPAGAWVSLDASGSSDPDSTLGTNDDILSFEWIEDLGLTSEKPLGTGERIMAQLALGAHHVSLRVTDRDGLVSIDDLFAGVVDTTPPTLAVDLSPDALWPPNHRLIDVTASVSASDLCGSTAITLASIASSEPDDAGGLSDGRTAGDIRDADLGRPDFHFRLRAERAGRLRGRTYTVTYRATDEAGNAADALATVLVTKSRAPSEP